jgi:hypothetical protein
MRTTGVKLVAETGQYKREMGAAAKATRGVHDELDKTAEAGKQGLAGIGREAKSLDVQIAATAANIGGLARAFAQTGDAGIIKTLKEQQRELRQLTNIRKLLPGDADAVRAGVSLGGKVATGMSRSIPPQLVGVLVAGGVAAAPLFASAFASALSAGAGAGVLGIGLAALAKDPTVALRGAQVGRKFNEGLQREATRALKGPALQALDQLDAAGARVTVRLGKAFDALGPRLDSFTGKVVGAGEAVANSLADSATESGPALDGLGDSVTLLGNSAATFIRTVSDGGPQAADNLRLLAGVTGDLVKHTGAMLDMANKLSSNAWLTGPLLPFLRKHYRESAEEANRLAAEQKKLPTEFDLTAQAVRGQRDALLALANQMRAATDPAFALLDAQQRLKKAQDAAAAAVKQHGRNSDEAKEATRRLALAAIDVQSKASGLASTFDGKLSPAMIATYRAAGLTEDQIAAVAVEFRGAKTSADKFAGDYRANASAPGAVGAKRDIDKAYTSANNFAGPYLANLSVKGKPAVDAALNDLLIKQQALNKGISVSAASSAFRKQEAKGYHDGGWTGPGPKMQPAGVVHADEFVVKKTARRQIEARHPGLLEEMNATGQVPAGYAAGGRVVRLPFLVSAANARIPSLQQALAAVAPSFGGWPSSPGAQRGDSGVWRRILQLIRSTGPLSGQFGNAYRPGDPKWHGSGRAVDWMGYNQDALSRFLVAKRPLEFIHRTRSRDYAYTRGRNMGSFNNSLMEAHRNHIHIAMANGGMIREPVYGVGASGATYSFAERGPERVLSAGQTAAGGGGSVTLVLQNHGVIGSRAEVDDWLTGAVDRLRNKGRI